MKYSHDLYDACMQILRFAYKQLMDRGDVTPAGTIKQSIDWAEKNFIFNMNDFVSLAPLIFQNWKVIVDTNTMDLTPAEREAVRCVIEDNGPRATSTKEAKAVVKEAGRRLAEEARLKPLTDAQKVVDEAEALKAKKKAELQRVQEERDRPEREAEAATSAVRDAKAAVKKAEKAVAE